MKYIGNLRERQGDYGTWFTGSICVSDIPKDMIATSEKNGKKYLNIVINKSKEVRFENTHSIAINEYKPKQEQSRQDKFEDDIPF